MTDKAASVTKSGLAGRSEDAIHATGTGTRTSLGRLGIDAQPESSNIAGNADFVMARNGLPSQHEGFDSPNPLHFTASAPS